MAVIANFPNFEGAAAPSADELNLAATRFAEAIGGVAADGTVYPGTLDTAALSPNAGFYNDQKAEPYSEFAIQFNLMDVAMLAWDAALVTIIQSTAPFVLGVGPLPVDAVLTEIVFVSSYAKEGKLTLKVNGKALIDLDVPATSAEQSWKMNYAVTAGSVLTIESTLADAVPTIEYQILAVFKAKHCG